MPVVRWTNPIEVKFTQGVSRTVCGPSEALHCLSDLWPNRRGPLYIAARSTCRAAIDGRKSVEEAREMFLFATEEAELNAH
ncbi:DUF982 domain-containing protein [Rhizobiaceae bacterium n13]|uniref:DUF982 domain-containing protein n=1 Tax=Ferirhizobium litorale TaxID=2927786 RepID=A0AAE3QJW0_9HYPH|nr:DUF982 domain-containing protein [Fererhizobium litorale]MDI7863972.1 DUF982 domain-containing protein [Fererhizobium litorale]MDI7924544.1 DUF982 domain-containing protein [Fererhizobium litorale]